MTAPLGRWKMTWVGLILDMTLRFFLGAPWFYRFHRCESDDGGDLCILYWIFLFYAGYMDQELCKRLGRMHFVYRTVNHYFVNIFSLILPGAQPLGKIKEINMMKTLAPLNFIWFYRGPTPPGCTQLRRPGLKHQTKPLFVCLWGVPQKSDKNAFDNMGYPNNQSAWGAGMHSS